MCANMPNGAPFDMYGAEDRRFSLRSQVIGVQSSLGRGRAVAASTRSEHSV